MVANVEGKLRLSEAALGGPGPRVPPRSAPSARERETFVLGIFAELDAAGAAVRRLSAASESGIDIVLVSKGSLLASGPPFRSLWTSLRVPDGVQSHAPPPSTVSHGSSWIAHHVSRSLADGASIVVVRTDVPEQQLAVSRTLLDAGCEVLLTHEVTLLASGTGGNHWHSPVIFP